MLLCEMHSDLSFLNIKIFLDSQSIVLSLPNKEQHLSSHIKPRYCPSFGDGRVADVVRFKPPEWILMVKVTRRCL